MNELNIHNFKLNELRNNKQADLSHFSILFKGLNKWCDGLTSSKILYNCETIASRILLEKSLHEQISCKEPNIVSNPRKII